MQKMWTAGAPQENNSWAQKTWMLVYANAKVAEALRGNPQLDREASRQLATRLFLKDKLEPLGGRRIFSAGGSGTISLHAMHSVVDWLAFGKWNNRKLVQSLSVSLDSGILEDIGQRLSFEEPFWSGSTGCSGASEKQSHNPTMRIRTDNARRLKPRLLHVLAAWLQAMPFQNRFNRWL